MWLLVFAGLLAISAGKEAALDAAEKSESSNADDLVMLEIDVKGPAKRSPATASAVYGTSPSQYVIRHGDDAQELTPEYLTLLQQYTQAEPQQYSASATSSPETQRRPLPGYARQQQNLQQAYQNQRVPAVSQPRPRLQLHPQALVRAEAAAQAQAQADIQSREQALHTAKLRASPHLTSYSPEKLGTFEQELLQLVSANQAQEFKLASSQPKAILKQEAYPQYSQQSATYPSQYVKASAESLQLPEQYHIETTAPRYQQQLPAGYQTIDDPSLVQYQATAHQLPAQSPVYQAKPTKPFRPSPRYPDPEEQARLKAAQQSQAHAEAQAIAQAQARAEAQALAFQKIAQASHNEHQQAALEQIRLVNERHRQQTALEQIRDGSQISEAGRAHMAEEQADSEYHLKAQLKAQVQAETAAARRAQQASEFKAHADAILALQAQQQAHLKAQEDAHKYALSFESNQLRAQAQAQAIAQAQAEALYKAHQQARAKANNEAQAAAKAQAEARKLDPEHTPVVQYLIPNSAPLPSPNSYFTNDQVQKYQNSGSSYVPRSAPSTTPATISSEEQVYAQQVVNRPRQAPHKQKVPQASRSSAYVSPASAVAPKKLPVKSLTIEEIIERDQLNSPQIVRLPSLKDQQPLTQEDLVALINAGYSIAPVSATSKSAQPAPYAIESPSTGYYTKKQRNPVAKAEYESYDQGTAAPAQRRPTRKHRPILKQDEIQSDASEKVTYLVPLESAYEAEQTSQRRSVGSLRE